MTDLKNTNTVGWTADDMQEHVFDCHATIAELEAEIGGNLECLPDSCRVIVREGGGLPNDAASLAASISKQTAQLTTANATIEKLQGIAGKMYETEPRPMCPAGRSHMTALLDMRQLTVVRRIQQAAEAAKGGGA